MKGNHRTFVDFRRVLFFFNSIDCLVASFAFAMDHYLSHSTTATMSEKEPGQSLQASKSILRTPLIGSRG